MIGTVPAEQLELSDPKAMRALAHPARLTILELLRAEGTTTATRCASEIGSSPQAASYHLRALAKWGLMARTVLARWNISKTLDFGRIVFAMVDNGVMQKTDEDTLDDFRDVFDFKSAFNEAGYRIEMRS